MRCCTSTVVPIIAGALLIAVTLILVSWNSGDSMNPGLIAAMAGGYVVCMPKRRCRGSAKASAEAGS